MGKDDFYMKIVELKDGQKNLFYLFEVQALMIDVFKRTGWHK